MAEFQTDKNDITKSRLVDVNNTEDAFTLSDGEILVKIERFAFTANNVTYGAVGEQIGYWQFFPPNQTDGEATEWGMVPVWGFAEVVKSEQPDVKIGERLYGYFPIADFLKITPTRVSEGRLVDGAPHRAELPPVYNNYDRVGAADAQADNLRSLLNPLYGTSFCLCDALQEQDYHQAEQVVIISASSKTAIGLAFGLSQIDGARPRIIGLTSSGNVDFTTSTGVYDEVIGYDALDKLADKPSVLVDMSGNRAVLGSVHGKLGDNMRWCHNVGLTHWDDSETKKDPLATQMIQDRSAMFFAPGHIQRRAKELGADAFNANVMQFMLAGIAHGGNWLTVKETEGLAHFGTVYDALVSGNINAAEGMIIRP